MKTVLIAYSSKTGTAAECVRMLERELKSLRVTVADLDRGAPELRGCDAVVFGSSVRFGKLRPAAARARVRRFAIWETSCRGRAAPACGLRPQGRDGA